MTTEQLFEIRQIHKNIIPAFLDLSEPAYDSYELHLKTIENFFRDSEKILAYRTDRIAQNLNNLPRDLEMDKDDTLVSELEKIEELLKSILLNLSGMSRTKELKSIRELIERICFTYIGIFQDLRWKILIHDGRVAPHEKETFCGRDGFLANSDVPD